MDRAPRAAKARGGGLAWSCLRGRAAGCVQGTNSQWVCVRERRGRLRLGAGGQGPRDPPDRMPVIRFLWEGTLVSSRKSLASWSVDLRGRELTDLGSGEYGVGRGRRAGGGGAQPAARAPSWTWGQGGVVESRLGGRSRSPGDLLGARHLGSTWVYGPNFCLFLVFRRLQPDVAPCKSGVWAITSKPGRRHPTPVLPASLWEGAAHPSPSPLPARNHPHTPLPREGDCPSRSPPAMGEGGASHRGPSEAEPPSFLTTVSGPLPSEGVPGSGGANGVGPSVEMPGTLSARRRPGWSMGRRVSAACGWNSGSSPASSVGTSSLLAPPLLAPGHSPLPLSPPPHPTPTPAR